MLGGVTDPPPMYFGLLAGCIGPPAGVVYFGEVVGLDGLGSVALPPVAGDDAFESFGI